MNDTLIDLFSEYGMVFFICLALIAGILSIYYENKRQNEITKNLNLYAKSNHYEIYNNDYNMNKLHIPKVFEQGHGITIKNVLIKREEMYNTYWGDHFFTTGSGKSSQSHNCSFVAIECNRLQFPSFFVRDENAIFDYLGKLFGGQDINFSGDDDFSPKFVLQGDSESRIRSLFTAKVRRAFTYNVACSGYRIYGNMHSILIEQEKQIDNINDRIKFEQKLKNIFSVIYSELTKEEIV